MISLGTCNVCSEAFGCWKCASLNLSYHMRKGAVLDTLFFINKYMRSLIKIAAATLILCVCVSMETFVQGFFKFTLPQTHSHTNQIIITHQPGLFYQRWEHFNKQRNLALMVMQRPLSPKKWMTTDMFLSPKVTIYCHSRSACFFLYSKNISDKGIRFQQQTKCHKNIVCKM